MEWMLGLIRCYWDALIGIAITRGLISSMHRLTAPAIFLLGLGISATDYATPFMHEVGLTIIAGATGVIILNVVSGKAGFPRMILESSAPVGSGASPTVFIFGITQF